jgi:dihydropteroate synthase
MGVVNVTPDSFSDGGRFLDPHAAIARANALIGEGADMLDIGAESSRPGARGISAEEELSRLMPVLDGLRASAVPISVDTVKPEVMRSAIAVGAAMINDINALRSPGALEAVTGSDVAV